MEFDEETKKRLLNLSDAELAKLIMQISEAAGGDPRRSQALMRDISSVRRTLERMSPSEAEKLLKSAGREKSEEIYRVIKGGS